MKYRGVDYYPEAWPEDRRSEDVRLMRDAKINLVKIGVFSWAKLEPEEGVYNFEWFKRIAGMISDAGMKLFPATPTAAPPAWLTSKYPEVLNLDENGNRTPHGMRRHYCPSSTLYRKFSCNIAGKMAEALSENPAVVAWQIDNEISIGETGPCYCPNCTARFQKWLETRYGSIEELDKAWNGAFWSGDFSSWSQIQPPYPRPSWQLDYVRFQSELFSAFIGEQVKAIRKHDSRSITTTNSWAGLNAPIDATEIFSNLDVASYDCYINYHGTLQAYQATMDLYRNLKKSPFWIAETGAWNCITAQDGSLNALRAWVFEFLARGADALVYFRWRQSVMGEEDHPAILSWSGQPGSRYDMVRKIFTELDSFGDKLQNLPLPNTETAILWNPSTAMLLRLKKRAYMQHVILTDTLLNRLGIMPDILPVKENLDLNGYKLIVLPQLETVDSILAEKIKDFVRNGGTALAQPRLALLDSNGKYLPEVSPVSLTDLFGIEIDERYDISGTQKYGPVQYAEDNNAPAPTIRISCSFDGREAKGFSHMEAPSAGAGCKILAKYSSGVFAGKPAVVENKYEKGLTFYQACWMDDDSTSSLLRSVAERSGIHLHAGAEGLTVIKRGKYRFYINHGSEKRSVSPVTEGKVALGNVISGKVVLAPYDVCIIQERPTFNFEHRI
jgi:beta-galactosidase